MKRIITGAFALVLFVGAAQAQVKRDTIHRRQGREMMSKQLKLSADQQAKLKSIQDAQRKEMETLETKSLTHAQFQQQKQAVHKKYSDQRQSVFTPAQKDQLQKLEGGRKGKGFQKGHGMKNRKDFGRRGAEFQKELNLSGTQKDQLSKMRVEVRSQVETIRKDQSLSQEQKKEKVQSIMKDQQAKRKSILTKEQIEKVESAQKERRSRATK